MKLTNGMSGAGSAAAASSAAIFGPGRRGVGRPAGGLADVDEGDVGVASLPASSENSGASCVQPTVSGAPAAAAARNLSSSARQSWRAGRDLAPRQPRFDRAGVERHRVFARADQDVARASAIGLRCGMSRAVPGITLRRRATIRRAPCVRCARSGQRDWPPRSASYNYYKEKSPSGSRDAAETGSRMRASSRRRSICRRRSAW